LGESQETILFGTGLPEGTISVRAKLQSITFADATTWAAAEAAIAE
jgi:hypothetical protein